MGAERDELEGIEVQVLALGKVTTRRAERSRHAPAHPPQSVHGHESGIGRSTWLQGGEDTLVEPSRLGLPPKLPRMSSGVEDATIIR